MKQADLTYKDIYSEVTLRHPLQIGSQSAIGTLRLLFTYLFLVGFKLLSEQSHQSEVVVPETDIAVMDFHDAKKCRFTL